jgi:hypothetical protein
VRAKTRDPISKIIKPKRAGGVTQVAECLPSKCEAPSSNPRTINNYINKSKKKALLKNIICFAFEDI